MKHYMYVTRCQKKVVSVEALKATFNHYKNCEYYNAKVNNKIKFHYKKWYNIDKSTIMKEYNSQMIEDLTHNYVIDMLLNTEK